MFEATQIQVTTPFVPFVLDPAPPNVSFKLGTTQISVIMDAIGKTGRPWAVAAVNAFQMISEVFQLYPAFPFNVRLALHDTSLPTGGGPDRDQAVGILKDSALAEIKYTIIRLLQRFERVEPRMRPQEQFMKTEIVMQPGAGVMVALRSPEI